MECLRCGRRAGRAIYTEIYSYYITIIIDKQKLNVFLLMKCFEQNPNMKLERTSAHGKKLWGGFINYYRQK